jgi:two-component system nitrogen regulation sensor histidine kinase NtrY
LLDETRETAKLYQQLESERGYELFQFGLIYLAFAVLLIVSSILLALLFAERLSRPIGRLAGAAQAVGEGNLDTQVIEEEGDDELSSLSRYFNQMTRQLKQQRDRLLENTQQIERRGRVFDSVLSSVTSGVFGLDPKGMITFANPSAERLLGKNKTDNASQLSLAVPEFAPLLERLQNSRSDNLQEEVKILRLGRLESFLVRLAPRRREDGRLEGYVVAFDDVTDLVSAQRSAAWGDVARRIAHEIKNPLTPIQLSAERIQRKFAPQLGAESGQLEQMTDVIIRQTNDLRRIVDEFSKFARMPELVKKSENLNEVLAAAVTLQESGQPGVTFELKMPDEDIWAEIDATMLSQALTNVLKNAGEAIEAGWRSGLGTDRQGEIRVEMQAAQSGFTIAISDNGIGLPQDRSKLFEPYVTTRENGTGLGLAIVKKIIQEHGGTLSLLDAAPFSNGSHPGAKVLIDLTHSDQTLMDSEQKEPN